MGKHNYNLELAAACAQFEKILKSNYSTIYVNKETVKIRRKGKTLYVKKGGRI